MKGMSGEPRIRTSKPLRAPVFKTGAIAVLPALHRSQQIYGNDELDSRRKTPQAWFASLFPASDFVALHTLPQAMFSSTIVDSRNALTSPPNQYNCFFPFTATMK
jgi:hypothetical protein